MKNITSRFSKVLLLSLFIYACVSEPEYPLEPFVEYRSIEQINYPGFDSVTIEIFFQDGDGDLGLRGDELYPEYGEWETGANGVILVDANGDSIPNLFFFNYFVEVLRKEGENFVPITFLDNQTLNGRYPILNTLGNETALEGELKYSFELFIDVGASPISRGDLLKFRIQIADRAKNLSNTVETEEIIAGEPFVPNQGGE